METLIFLRTHVFYSRSILSTLKKIFFPKLQTTSENVFTQYMKLQRNIPIFQFPPPPVLQTDCTV